MKDLSQVFASVVMPVYNSERFIEKALESVLNQSFENFELIIIDDGSTDSTIEKINNYKDNRIKIIRQDHQGAFSAYNTGFKKAMADYIFIMDHDDIADISRFKCQLYEMIKSEIDICGTFFNLVDNNGRILERRELPIDHEAIVESLQYKNYTIFNPSVCIRKKVFEDYGYFDPSYFPSSDYEFYLRVSKKVKFQNLPEFLYSWRVNINSISNSNKEKVLDQTLKISQYYLNKYKQESSFCYFYTSGLIYYYNNKLGKAFQYFCLALLKGKLSIVLFKYLILSSLLSPLLYLYRKYQFLHIKLYGSIKKLWSYAKEK